MGSALAALDGQPVATAFAKFGPPDEEKTVAGNKIYIWAVDEFGPLGIPPDLALQYKCRVRVTSDSQNIVRGAHWEGNAYGCNKLLAGRS